MGGPFLLYFPGKEPPHKEFLGSDPNWGHFGVFLHVCVRFFSLASLAETLNSATRSSRTSFDVERST